MRSSQNGTSDPWNSRQMWFGSAAQTCAAATSPSGLAMQCGANGTKWRAARSPIRTHSAIPPAFWMSGVTMCVDLFCGSASNPSRR